MAGREFRDCCRGLCPRRRLSSFSLQSVVGLSRRPISCRHFSVETGWQRNSESSVLDALPNSRARFLGRISARLRTSLSSTLGATTDAANPVTGQYGILQAVSRASNDCHRSSFRGGATTGANSQVFSRNPAKIFACQNDQPNPTSTPHCLKLSAPLRTALSVASATKSQFPAARK